MSDKIKSSKKDDIVCDNCDWSWNKIDTKPHDMYVCHKCGNDNSEKYNKTKDGVKESIRTKVSKKLRKLTNVFKSSSNTFNVVMINNNITTI